MTSASEKESALEADKIYLKDPFHGLPLSNRQKCVFPTMILKQFWNVSFQYWFAIYAKNGDPKALGFSAAFLGWLFFAQVVIGFADTVGRLPVYRGCVLLMAVCALLIAFLPYNFIGFLVCCFFCGVGHGPCAPLQTFLWNEALPLRYLHITSNFMFGLWSIIIPTVLYLWMWMRTLNQNAQHLEDWRWAMCMNAMLVLLHLLSTFSLLPSVPWLVSKQKYEKALESFNALSHYSSKNLGDKFRTSLKRQEHKISLEKNGDEKGEGAKRKAECQYFRNIAIVCCHNQYRWTVVAGIFQFASSGLAFWGMGLQAPKFLPAADKNLELTLSLMALTELPASFLAWWCPRKFGIVNGIAILFSLQAICFTGLFLPATL